MESYLSIKVIASSLLYSFLGLAIFAAGFLVADRLTPGKLWDEIIVKQNLAVAVLFGSIAIAISMIIAAAIQS